jgi:hypothetical protein
MHRYRGELRLWGKFRLWLWLWLWLGKHIKYEPSHLK